MEAIRPGPRRRALQRERRLRAEADRLAGLMHALAESVELDEALERIARAGLDLLEADVCGVALPSDGGLLRFTAARGDDPQAMSRYAFGPGEGCVGRAYSEGRVQHVADLQETPDPHQEDVTRLLGVRSVLCLPVTLRGRVLGVLAAASRRPDYLDAESERVLGRLADLAALAIGHADQRAILQARADQLAALSTQLRQSEARFRGLTDSLLEAVYETDLTKPHRPTGVLRYYSPNVERMLGYPLSAWYADDALFVKGLHPDDRDRVLAEHDELRAGGRTMETEYRWIKPSGEVVWIQDRARIERGPLGEPLVLRGTNADVTARKQLEEQLRRSDSEARALYRAALSIGGALVLDVRLERLLDAALELTAAKQARVALVSQDGESVEVVAVRGSAVFSLGICQPREAGLTGDVLRSNAPIHSIDLQTDPRNWNPDLTQREGVRSWLGVPLGDGEETFGALIVTAEEAGAFSPEDERRLVSLAALAGAAVREARLRERLAEAEALRELARLKDEFLSTVSHELRTPLAVVCGYAELLLTRQFSPERVREVVEEMSRAAQVMVRLVDDLLDLGRIERGDLHLTFDAVDVARELRGAAARQLGHASRHQFVVRIDSVLPPARADAGRMRQIIDNLVENALRYATPGQVTLRACHQGVWVQVEVEDSGPGLAPEVAARVFEKFYRAPDARHSQSRGTGIGLAVVKELIEAQQGEVGVRPSECGGSIFWFRLPTA